MHKKMTLNLVVPNGKCFLFYDSRRNSKTLIVFLKLFFQKNYKLLTVFLIFGLDLKAYQKTNLICNIADIEHDDNEILRKNIDEINFNWKINENCYTSWWIWN